MTPGEPRDAEGAARLGRLLQRATSATSRAPLSPAQHRAFVRALAGERPPAVARNRRGLWGAAVVWTAAAAAAVVLSTWRAPRALTFELDGVGARDEGAAIETLGAGAGTVRFSDGSALAFTHGSRARVLDTDARGARLAVESGEVAFRIRHREGARWSVKAGPFEILVTGTAFDVRWTADGQLRLRLTEGAVVVRGSLAGAGREVRAGQTFVARLADGTVRLGAPDDAAPAARPAPAEPPAPPSRPAPSDEPPPGEAPPAEAPPGEAPPADDPPPPHPAPRARSLPPPVPATTAGGRGATWRRWIASGDFDRVIADAQRQGIDACVARCDEEALDALARAARYHGLPDLARRALTALRARRSGSELGHEATFFLGRLAEGEGNAEQALSFYDAYLDEGMRGQYGPYVLGRKMVLVERLRGAAAARPVAETYLRLYPGGAHGAHARRLLGAQ